jgi:hypothetical protein
VCWYKKKKTLNLLVQEDEDDYSSILVQEEDVAKFRYRKKMSQSWVENRKPNSCGLTLFSSHVGHDLGPVAIHMA